MKKQFVYSALLSIILILTFSCQSGDKEKDNAATISTDVIDVPLSASGKPAKPGSAPEIAFNEKLHEFGKITQGEKVSYSFVFKNTGGSDVVISSAHGSCGCTVPSYPKDPVKPGEESKINVVFDSEGKSGLVQKTITLITNCNPSTKVLTISATIIVPEEE